MNSDPHIWDCFECDERKVLGAAVPITVSMDEQQHLARYTVSGDVTGQEVLAFMAEALRAHPGLADCDTICDLTAYTGSVTADEVASLALLTNESRIDPVRAARTAYVTHDSGFSNWAQVMNHQFDARKFCVFGSVKAAEAWLRGYRHGREAA